MKLWSDSFSHAAAIPEDFAFGRRDDAGRIALSANRSPHLAWSDLPAGTKSLALVCHDPDVPSKPDDVNKDGRRVPAELPRVDFYHWILFDIPADRTELPAGFGADGITARGKPGPEGPEGTRHGANDYTSWFAGDADMDGIYCGYDGPCPPYNDTLVHHYWFTLYALDVETAPIEGVVRGAEAVAALRPHVLGEAKLMGTYSIAADAEDRGAG
jgi:Raf kinase inhibitor-like YbhB/YbcL family protein